MKERLEGDLRSIQAVNSDLQSTTADLEARISQKDADLVKRQQESNDLRSKMLAQSEADSSMSGEFKRLQSQLSQEV